jgi:Fe2+ or Zn2+ uptake regulation protein
MTLKITPKRQAVLDLLKNSKQALSASEISAKLPDINLVTIYRTLDLLSSEKIIKKFQFDETEAKYEYQHEPHHHAVCSVCDKVIHFTAPDEKIKKLLGLKNFSVDEIEVTVKGECPH